MKINKKDSNTLEIETSTLFFKFIGLVFFIAGLVFLYFMTENYALTCQSKKSQCMLTHQKWFTKSETHYEKINKAKLTYKRKRGGNKNYYLTLKTSSGKVKLNTIGSPSRSTLKENARKINQYLKTPKGTLQINTLYPYWFYILPIAFIIISDLIIFIPKKSKVVFDKTENKLRISRKNIFSSKEKNYPLDEIKEVILEESYGRNGRLYRVAFLFKDETSVPLTNTYDNFLPSKIKAISAICDFLHLPNNQEIDNLRNKQSIIASAIFFIALAFIIFILYLTNVLK